MLLAIPSKNRASHCKTIRFFQSYATVYCPEEEVDQYKVWGCAVIGVPKNIVGITKTRNWILNHTDERWVVFMDDDMRRAGYIKPLWSKSKRIPLRAPALMDEFRRLFEVSEGIGFPVWGVCNNSSFRNFSPYQPFIWQTCITATCMGIINEPSGLRFDENYEFYEDYDLGLRCLVKYGGVVGARYFYFETELGNSDGGVSSYKTSELEDAATKRLLASYPGLIRKTVKKDDSYEFVLNF